MLPEYGVTEIYCMVDDFCKEIVLQQKKIKNTIYKFQNINL